MVFLLSKMLHVILALVMPLVVDIAKHRRWSDRR
ncbi:Uncharacterised protein [Serratia rubidaea]|uniref:Uncharacterized protein n=1 Tax=Serratia rubidaea TaxID=61652 RepID=A0A3S4FLN3_SERRU|nr:Uncharacterised protein [Serratia rubidaea]